MIDIIQFAGETEHLGFKRIIQQKQLRIMEGGPEEKNRKAVESKQTDILLSPEKDRTKKYFTQYDSGLNEVLCRAAQKNKVAIGFSFSSLLNAKNKILVLGQMMQNVRLCQKYKVRMVVASFAQNKWEMRSVFDLLSFARVLGMVPKEAKAAFNFQRKRKEMKVLQKS